jgi:hypothetical protein
VVPSNQHQKNKKEARTFTFFNLNLKVRVLDQNILLASRPESSSIKMLGTRTPRDTTEVVPSKSNNQKIRKEDAHLTFFNIQSLGLDGKITLTASRPESYSIKMLISQ